MEIDGEGPRKKQRVFGVEKEGCDTSDPAQGNNTLGSRTSDTDGQMSGRDAVMPTCLGPAGDSSMSSASCSSNRLTRVGDTGPTKSDTGHIVCADSTLDQTVSVDLNAVSLDGGGIMSENLAKSRQALCRGEESVSHTGIHDNVENKHSKTGNSLDVKKQSCSETRDLHVNKHSCAETRDLDVKTHTCAETRNLKTHSCSETGSELDVPTDTKDLDVNNYLCSETGEIDSEPNQKRATNCQNVYTNDTDCQNVYTNDTDCQNVYTNDTDCQNVYTNDTDSHELRKGRCVPQAQHNVCMNASPSADNSSRSRDDLGIDESCRFDRNVDVIQEDLGRRVANGFVNGCQNACPSVDNSSSSRYDEGNKSCCLDRNVDAIESDLHSRVANEDANGCPRVSEMKASVSEFKGGTRTVELDNDNGASEDLNSCQRVSYVHNRVANGDANGRQRVSEFQVSVAEIEQLCLKSSASPFRDIISKWEKCSTDRASLEESGKRIEERLLVHSEDLRKVPHNEHKACAGSNLVKVSCDDHQTNHSSSVSISNNAANILCDNHLPDISVSNNSVDILCDNHLPDVSVSNNSVDILCDNHSNGISGGNNDDHSSDVLVSNNNISAHGSNQTLSTTRSDGLQESESESCTKNETVPIVTGSQSESGVNTEIVPTASTPNHHVPDVSSFNINDLPLLNLVHIFRYISRATLLNKVSVVCKHWYDASRDPSLWRQLNLAGQHRLMDVHLEWVLQYSDRILDVDLSDCPAITDVSVRYLLRRCHHLQSLKLLRCHQVTEAFQCLEPGSLPSLETLYISCYKFDDTLLTKVAQACPRLRALHASLCKGLSDRGITSLAQACPQLRLLDLENCTAIGNTSLEMLAEHCPKLTSLYVMQCHLTDIGILHLGKLCHLTTLDISNLPNVTSQAVAQMARRCRTLECLNVSLNRYIDDTCIAEVARCSPNLLKFYCVSCAVTDAGVAALVRHCPKLTFLDLGWCMSVTDASVRLISESCRDLRCLGLIRCDGVSVEVVDEMSDEHPHIYYSSFVIESRRLMMRAQQMGIMFGQS